MDASTLVYWTLLTGVMSALATGLGAIPVAFLKGRSAFVKAFAGAFAAGMMISASVFSLAQKGIELRSTRASAPYEVIVGLLLGAVFVSWVQGGFGAANLHWGDMGRGRTRKGFLLFLVMFVHSIPEGVAIGVGFATGDLTFGLIMATAISVHNIPEGIAISLPLRTEGVSFLRCAGLSVLSSVPQPLVAPPAALAVWLFQPLLATGLGFAGGAMMYVVVQELVPDALEDGGRRVTAWGVMTGLAGMLLLTTVLDLFGAS